MKIKIILMTEGEWCRADSYEEALEKLDRQINADYYREKEEGKESDLFVYEKEEVVPKVMILTDDETAEIDRYGQLLTEGGCWHVTIPLVGKRPPSPCYRFCIMQDLKDKDFKEELENHLVTKYGAEFDEWCDKQGATERCKGCEFEGSKEYKFDNDDDGPTCFMQWYKKYKKPELDKDKKDEC